MEPGAAAKRLKLKEQHCFVAEAIINRRYFKTARAERELHVFADASEDTLYAVAYLSLKTREY